jgi:hypothetical protein
MWTPGFEVDLGTSVSVDYSNVVTTDNSNFDVVYRASDGVNPDTVVLRRVAVADTLSPVVILNGPSVITLERYAEYVEQSVTLDPGSSLVSTTTDLDNTTVGSYTVTYLATDNINPNTTNVRTINVVDTTAPIVTLNGASSVTLERYGVFADTDPGVTIDANGTLASVDISQLNNTTQGTYTVTYNVVDDHNNANVITREVVVEDTVPPVVTLNNESTSYTLERYGDWSAIDPGVTIDIGSYLDSVTVDNTSTGLKVVTYTVKDGTNTTQKNRVIRVEDTVAPVGSIKNPSYQLERFAVFNDPGVENLDAGTYLAGTDTSNVDNTLAHGSTFDVIYDLGDDNTSNLILTRTVTVVDTTPPSGSIANPSYELERFAIFNDPGVENLDAGTYLAGTDTSNVDNTLPHNSTFDVVYDLGDGTNNTHIIRTVTIVDTTPPVGSINNPSYTLERFGTYVDQGVTNLDAGTYLASTDTSNVDNTLVHGSTFDVVYDLGDGTNNTHIIRTVTVVDTTPPSGSIANPSYELERFAVFNDPGVENLDAGTYLASTDTSNVDNTLPHNSTFDVIYDLGDDNTSNLILTRTVTVVDTTPPVASLQYESYTTERFGTYVDPGDSDITLDEGSFVAGTDLSNVDTSITHGSSFDVVYDIADSNALQNVNLIRRVTVVDTVDPVITELGTPLITLERYAPIPDFSTTVSLDEGSYLTSVNIDALDNTVIGSYSITYNASDGVNTNQLNRTVQVSDTVSPVITINGANPYYVERFSTFNDPYASADPGSTLLPADLSNVDMDGVHNSTFDVVYTATDGNTTSQAVRSVVVVDTVPPVITLTGGDYSIERFASYSEMGVTVDEGSTYFGSDTTNVNTSLVYGNTFDVVYTAFDGNTFTNAIRTITIEDTVPPVITIAGDNPQQIYYGDTYTDPGTTVSADGFLSTDLSNVNTNLENGTFDIVYNATDGNTAHDVTATRTVVCNVYRSFYETNSTYNNDMTIHELYGRSVTMSTDGTKYIISSYAGFYIAEMNDNGVTSGTDVYIAPPATSGANDSTSAAISGDNQRVVCGSILTFPSGGINDAIDIHKRNSNGTWSREARLLDTYNIKFGSSVSISHDGSMLAVTSANDAGTIQKAGTNSTSSNYGSLGVYKRVNSTWSLVQMLVPSIATSYFTYIVRVISCAISGDGKYIVAIWHTYSTDYGHSFASIFNGTTSSWSQVFNYAPANNSIAPHTQIDYYGNKVFIGERLYTRSGSTWTYRQTISSIPKLSMDGTRVSDMDSTGVRHGTFNTSTNTFVFDNKNTVNLTVSSEMLRRNDSHFISSDGGRGIAQTSDKVLHIINQTI